MLTLDAITKSLEIKLAGAVATTELPFVASYVDLNQSTIALTASGASDGTTTGATAVPVTAAPAATTTRKLNYLSVVNVDTASCVLTVQVNNSGTKRIVFSLTLAVGDQLAYVDAHGWSVRDASGNLKQQIGGVLPAASFPALSGDVTTTAGSLVTTIGAGKVTNAMLAGSIAAAKLIATDFTVITASGLITGGSLSIGGTSTLTGSAGFGMAPSASYAFSCHGVTADGTKGAFRCEDSGGNTTAYVLNDGSTYLKGATRVDGVLTVNGFGTHAFAVGGTGFNVLQVSNPTAGAGNGAAVYIGNDIAPYRATIYSLSSTYSTSGYYKPESMVIEGGGVNGISVAASSGTGTIRFYTNGSNLRGTITAAGVLDWRAGGEIDTTYVVFDATTGNPMQGLTAITSAAGTATVITASGAFQKLSSSARYKEHLEPWAVTPEVLDRFVALSPKRWDYLGQETGAAGFIAEDLDNLVPNAYGRSALLNYDDTGRPESNRDYALIGLQHLVIQDLWRRVAALEGKHDG